MADNRNSFDGKNNEMSHQFVQQFICDPTCIYFKVSPSIVMSNKESQQVNIAQLEHLWFSIDSCRQFF
jgi:hypothetical protein